ncbi:hypothetical protein FRC98_01765 [Lujinxingia vulgaris]|uniref:Glycosyltransferase RgtA/B/C/D-like domain-containing protein n=1 Tax=Lujinxingia vulgaris TaxID=2600176 RepID=A0A5C6XH03_9DELT|nr:hypothetical protein [Lujinxingia vulgaris]TXD39154.1 hypothetical protein FRC98_01765 [Lujinxingia vulgaris]
MSTPPRQTPARIKLAAALFPAALTLALLGLSLMRHDATWWRVAYGRLISAFGRIPDKELLVFTAPDGAGWLDTSWLASVAIFRLVDLGGIEAAMVTRSALVALAVAMVGWAAAERSPRPKTFLNVAWLGVPAAVFFSAVGPESLALPIATLGLIAATRALTSPRPGLLATIVMSASAFALVNLALPAALVMMATSLAVGAYALRTGAKLGAAVAFAGALVAPLASPLGFGVLVHLSKSPALPTRLPGPLSVTLSLSTGAVGLALWARHARATQMLFAQAAALAIPAFLLTLWASLMPAMMPLQHLALVLLLAPAIVPPERFELRRPTLALLASLVLLAAAVLTQPALPWHADLTTRVHADARQAIPMRGVVPDTTPLACGELLRRAGKELRVFNDPTLAGYLAYALWRPERIEPILYTDTRDLSTETSMKLYELAREQPILRGVAQQENINAAVIRPDHHPATFDDLYSDPTWALLAGDRDQPVACFLKAAPAYPGTWVMP